VSTPDSLPSSSSPQSQGPWHLRCVGIDHTAATVERRERFVRTDAEAEQIVQQLIADPSVAGALLVSTCNRTECYAVVADHLPDDGLLQAAVLPADATDDDAKPLTHRSGRAAVEHLMRVASGMAAQIVGETQILGQVKQAIAISAKAGAANGVMGRLADHVIGTAKRVHTETDLCRGAVSVPYAAVELAGRVLGPLAGHRVLLIGAGETAELVARHLAEKGVRDLTIANRTRARADALAATFTGGIARVVDWTALGDAVCAADIVVSSTGAKAPVIDSAMASRAASGRTLPLLLMDIAVPRDVHPDVQALHNVLVYTLDDLHGAVEENLSRRVAEMEKAERIVAERADAFEAWMRERAAVPMIRALRERAEAIRDEELERLRDRLPADQFTQVAEIMRRLVNRLLQEPTDALKRADPETDEGMQIIRDLRGQFGLDEP
jgi:glutamyl-tRNA reductase